MNVTASGRTWEDASSPAAHRLARRYEEAWQKAGRSGTRLDPADFLSRQGESGELPGSWLAILRSDLGLRWDAGDRVTAQWYLDRFPRPGRGCPRRPDLRGVLPAGRGGRGDRPGRLPGQVQGRSRSRSAACWISIG